jgi:hypothetical protein
MQADETLAFLAANYWFRYALMPMELPVPLNIQLGFKF